MHKLPVGHSLSPYNNFLLRQSDFSFVEISDGFQRAECIVSDPEGNCIYAADKRGGVMCVELATKKSRLIISKPDYIKHRPAGYQEDLPNGLAWYDENHILIANFGLGILEIINITTGQRRMLLAEFDGKPLGHANHVIIDLQGRIYLSISTTDDDWLQAINPNTKNGHILLITGDIVNGNDYQVTKVADGICFANEVRINSTGNLLIAAETLACKLSCFSINPDGTLGEKHSFGPDNLGILPDGFVLDRNNNAIITGVHSDRIIVVAPDKSEIITIFSDESRTAEHATIMQTLADFKSDDPASQVAFLDALANAGWPDARAITSVNFVFDPETQSQILFLGNLFGSKIPWTAKPWPVPILTPVWPLDSYRTANPVEIMFNDFAVVTKMEIASCSTLDETTLRRSIALAIQHHPLLNKKLVRGDNVFFTTAPGYELQMQVSENEMQTREINICLINRNAVNTFALIVVLNKDKSDFAKGKYNYTLFLALNHSICDAMSALNLLNELLLIYDNLMMERVKVVSRDPIEDAYQLLGNRKYEQAPISPSIARLNSTLDSENMYANKTLVTSDSPLTYLDLDFTNEQTKAIVNAAHQHRISIHAALCSAFVKAFYSSLKIDDLPFLLSCPVDIRSRQSLDPGRLGLLASLAYINFHADPTMDFWETADHISGVLNKILIDPNFPDSAKSFCERVMKTPLASGSVSNIGTFRFKDSLDDTLFQVNRVGFTLGTQRQLNFPYFSVVTLKELTMQVLFDKKLFPMDLMRTFISCMKDTILTSCPIKPGLVMT